MAISTSSAADSRSGSSAAATFATGTSTTIGFFVIVLTVASSTSTMPSSRTSTTVPSPRGVTTDAPFGGGSLAALSSASLSNDRSSISDLRYMLDAGSSSRSTSSRAVVSCCRRGTGIASRKRRKRTVHPRSDAESARAASKLMRRQARRLSITFALRNATAHVSKRSSSGEAGPPPPGAQLPIWSLVSHSTNRTAGRPLACASVYE
mmetsp:Transcript_54604/g.150306  ORF Transcript_54604/g.150306 Transcript_54604/m.150306 type:complete len:207 (-) Transcript_54604:3111-3731(-)